MRVIRLTPRKLQQGASLVQLVIGVAVALMIAVFVIPNLLHSRITTNESAALASLRTLNASCVSYAMLHGSYPQSLSSLGPGDPANSAAPGLIDSSLANGAKSGYVFTYTPGATGVSGNVLSYSITANPVAPGSTGRRGFFTDQSGVIRANPAGAAGASSTPVG